MFRRLFEWLFSKELKATEEIDLNAECPRCEQRAFYQYSLDDQTIYRCPHCDSDFSRMFKISPCSEFAEQR